MDVPGLLSTLFPDACLPLPAADILAKLSSGSSALYIDCKWKFCPDLAQRLGVEQDVADFFNHFAFVVENLCAAAGRSRPKGRRWTAEFVDHGIENAPNVWKPEFFLGSEANLDWSNTSNHGVLKSSDSSDCEDTALKQLLNGAYHTFSSQDNRRFVVSVALFAERIQLYIFDRAGLVNTAPFHIHNDPEAFVRVWTALMFADSAVLGYDPTIVETALGVRHIEVEGRKYDIVGSNALFISEGIRGRGTVCWRVRHGGREFVIKDTWDDAARLNTEAQILDIAISYGVVGIPQVVASKIVDVGGIKGTDALRSSLPSDIYEEECAHIEKRLHRRLVLTPFGHALHTFSTRKELLSALRDAVEAHQSLYDKAEILHRDISVNNILLIPSAQMPPPRSASLLSPAVGASSVHTAAPILRRGLLIDVDRALVLGPTGEHKTAPAHRTGTLPFMAIDVLRKGKTLPQHLPRHDLESFLYVLIWICVHYAGPNGVVRQNFKIYHSWLKDWVGGTSYKSIGGCKGYSMLADDGWEEVLNCFAPYFEPLKTCATAWRKLFCDKQLNYKEVSRVLQTAIDLLDDSETWSSKDDPAGYGAWNLNKRKRQVEANPAGSIAKEDDDVFNDHRPPLEFLRSDGSPERVPVARSVPEPRARKSIKNGLKPNHRRMLSKG
ncbi:hypothetical protein R3P38DRAFT_2559945 [Favolaschia claudopus]|uniref:Fungal-type protein kinase domain-containing protein n=1 Tax=Favolaschia claudopus TaxID=2862362 RepID=A0AAW0A4G0_9AGAR